MHNFLLMNSTVCVFVRKNSSVALGILDDSLCSILYACSTIFHTKSVGYTNTQIWKIEESNQSTGWPSVEQPNTISVFKIIYNCERKIGEKLPSTVSCRFMSGKGLKVSKRKNLGANPTIRARFWFLSWRERGKKICLGPHVYFSEKRHVEVS